MSKLNALLEVDWTLNRWWSILGQDEGCLRSGRRSAVSLGPFTTTCCLKCCPRNVLIDMSALKICLETKSPTNSYSFEVKHDCSTQIVWTTSKKTRDTIVQKSQPHNLPFLILLRISFLSNIWLFHTKNVVMDEKRKGHSRQPQVGNVMSGQGIWLTASLSELQFFLALSW